MKQVNIMHWSDYAKNDELRAVIDPGDTKGHKNRYINLLHHKVLKNAFGERFNGNRVLDLGCGIGRFNDLLHCAGGTKLIGIDSCQEMLDKNNGLTILCPVTSLPFPDEHFDVVLSVWTLQYLDDQQLEIASKEIGRVLKPGGTIYLIEQMSLDGYDHVVGRMPSDYRDNFAKRDIILVSSRPIMYAFDKLITVIRLGLIPESFFKTVSGFHLWFTRTLLIPLHDKKHGYVDYFIEFTKVLP